MSHTYFTPNRWLISALLLFVLLPCFIWLRVDPLLGALADGMALLWIGCFVGLVFLCSIRTRFTWSFWLLGIALLVASVGLSIGVNSYSLETMWRWYLVFMLASVGLCLALYQLLFHLGEINYTKLLAQSLLVGLLCYALLSLGRYYGLLQWTGWAVFVPASGRMGGMWAQANLHSTSLWLGVVASCYVCRKPHWWLASLIVFGWGIACAASRMSWLIALSILVLALVGALARWQVTDAGPVRRRLGAAALLMMLLFLLVPLVNQPLNSWLTEQGWLQRANSISLQERDALHDTNRTGEWSKTWYALPDMSTKELWLGVGPGRYTYFSSLHDDVIAPNKLMKGAWGHAHNLLIMVFVEQGIIGLLVVLGLLGTIIFQLLRAPFTRERLFIAGALAVLLIHSMLEFPLWYAWFLGLFWMLTVPLFGTYKVTLNNPRLKLWFGGFVLLLTLIFLGGVGWQYKVLVTVAQQPDVTQEDYQQLVVMRNNPYVGPYASLLRYRHFGLVTDSSELAWQVNEVSRLMAWQPRDLVMLRDYFLKLVTENWRASCEAAEKLAWRYPNAAPYMLAHSLEKHWLDEAHEAEISACIEQGLSAHHETMATMRAKLEKKGVLQKGYLDKVNSG